MVLEIGPEDYHIPGGKLGPEYDIVAWSGELVYSRRETWSGGRNASGDRPGPEDYHIPGVKLGPEGDIVVWSGVLLYIWREAWSGGRCIPEGKPGYKG